MTIGTLQIVEKYFVICCHNCGVSFAITDSYDDRRRHDHKAFYCPNGHSMSYSGDNEAEKQRKRADQLERRLANKDEDLRAERAQHSTTRNRLSATKGVLTKTKKRIAHGVCPCCKRTFANVQRHMAGQHPDYAEQATP